MTARQIRELRETTRQHGEQLVAIVKQLGALTEQVGQITARHTDLAAAVSEDLAPRVGALHQLVTEELGRLRSDLDVLLAERNERDKTKNPPVDWATLTEEQAAAQWPILARWVGEVLVPRYELTRDDLPDCWALHPPVVAELSWLHTAYARRHARPALRRGDEGAGRLRVDARLDRPRRAGSSRGRPSCAGSGPANAPSSTPARSGSSPGWPASATRTARRCSRSQATTAGGLRRPALPARPPQEPLHVPAPAAASGSRRSRAARAACAARASSSRTSCSRLPFGPHLTSGTAPAAIPRPVALRLPIICPRPRPGRPVRSLR